MSIQGGLQMESIRTEILPGVWLTALQSDKFKTGCMSINLLTQLDRDTASMNAVIPYVLKRGTNRHTSMQAIAKALDSLYGSCIEPVVRRIGEIQCIGFFASFPDEKYLPAESAVTRSVAELMAEILLSPNTKAGLLREDYVESEKEKLVDIIRSRMNEKRGYAIQRLIGQMCCYEDFATPRYGTVEAAEGIFYRKLTKHYRELISTSPVEIFYCGSKSADELAEIFSDVLCVMPRGEINYEIGTDIRMNAVEEHVRMFTDEMAVTQGKLVMGFRLGDCMDDPNLPAIYVFNAMFGGGVTSKLFMNVREKLSLCYYAASLADTHKGLLIADSGIDPDKFEAVRDEILAQLETIKLGDFTDEELDTAKCCVASDLRSAADSQGALEGFYLANAIDGMDCDPMALAELAENVTADEVSAIARSTVLDAVYFLRPGAEEGENDEDNEI